MILRDIIQRISKTNGVQSDDKRLRPRRIYNKLLTVRSLLLSQKSSQRQRIGEETYQTLSCIEMIVAPHHECPCIPSFGCEILKSKYPIPSILMDKSSPMIRFVTNIDGSIRFNPTTWSSKKHRKGNKYTKDSLDYFFKGGHLYITNKKGPRLAVLSAIFTDPYAASKFPSMCEEDCVDCKDCSSPLDKDFPIDSSMLEPLVALTREELVDPQNQARLDDTNNSSDET